MTMNVNGSTSGSETIGTTRSTGKDSLMSTSGQFDSLLASMLGGGLFGLAPVQPVLHKESLAKDAGSVSKSVSMIAGKPSMDKKATARGFVGNADIKGASIGKERTGQVVFSRETPTLGTVASDLIPLPSRRVTPQMNETDRGTASIAAADVSKDISPFAGKALVQSDLVKKRETSFVAPSFQPAPMVNNSRSKLVASIQSVSDKANPGMKVKDKTSASAPQDLTGLTTNGLNAWSQLNGTQTVHKNESTSSTKSQFQIDARDPGALNQFGKLISVNTNAQHTELHVQIVPQGMGHLSVTVTNAGNGVQVHVTANEASTFAWLNQQLPQIQESMQAAGLNVSGFQLSYGKDSQDSGGHSKQNKSSSRKLSSVAPTPSSVISATSDGTRALSTHVGDISVSV